MNYLTIWRNKFLTIDATSLDEMIEMLQGATGELKEMRAAGVKLSDDGGVGDDYAHLVTDDPQVAERFGFESEKEFYGDEDEDEEDFDDEEEDEEEES